MTTNKIAMQIRIHRPALAALRRMADQRGLPMSEIIRRAIDDLIAKYGGYHIPMPSDDEEHSLNEKFITRNDAMKTASLARGRS